MPHNSLGSLLSALRRRPTETELHLTPARGWEPLPDDVAEWMGAKPYPLQESA